MLTVRQHVAGRGWPMRRDGGPHCWRGVGLQQGGGGAPYRRGGAARSTRRLAGASKGPVGRTNAAWCMRHHVRTCVRCWCKERLSGGAVCTVSRVSVVGTGVCGPGCNHPGTRAAHPASPESPFLLQLHPLLQCQLGAQATSSWPAMPANHRHPTAALQQATAKVSSRSPFLPLLPLPLCSKPGRTNLACSL